MERARAQSVQARLNILPRMSETPGAAPRELDERAVSAALRRLAKQPSPPWLHEEVARRMAERLQIIKLQPKRVVDWWAFLGGGGALLDAAYPQAERTSVEPGVLLERSRDASRKPWWSPRRLRGGPVVIGDSQALPGGTQLVWANMVLHAVREPTAVLARWERALAADGFVMFSCFGPDTLRELRDLYARLGWPAPMAPFVDMHDLGDMLVHAGFADPVMDQETLMLTWPDASSLLAELRALGGNASPARFPGLRTPRWRARLERELQALAGTDGRLSMRFEIAYGHAFKAPPRLRADQPTTVSLDDMRALVRSARRTNS